jgi:phosphohistidine phosphatase
MRLYIVRHAWAGERDPKQWPDDDLRPLTRDGQKRFAKFIKCLNKRGFAPAVVATSPLVRCRQTADIIAEYSSTKPEVVSLDALSPESDLTALVDWTAARSEDSIAWVGHAPAVSHLVAALIGNGNSDVRFAKGAVAAIDFTQPIAPTIGQLQWLAPAKLMGL